MNKPALHILSLPHTQLDPEYVSCAYTMKALKLAKMMDKLGYQVYLYGSQVFDIAGTDIIPITCITKEEQHYFFGDNDHKKTFYNITWDPNDAHWRHFNKNAIQSIAKVIKDTDLILTFAGVCQKEVADAFPNHITVEAGIGYTGVFSKFKVFESYAWMHFVHGLLNDDNGDFYETVIPNYWDPKEFPLAKERGDYYLYIGRLIDRKGYRIAQQVCESLGKRLILAGQIDGEFQGYGEYIGTVGVEERGKLMSEAIAVFTPTTYLGPFEGTHVEAQLSGAPVITTPFGVYTETVEDGVNGWKCHDFQEFVNAAKWAQTVSDKHRAIIQESARSKWSMDEVAKRYDTYFQQLLRLKEGGWYQEY
jgi:glycosyltransferase involved in cell wall biosynthesis